MLSYSSSLTMTAKIVEWWGVRVLSHFFTSIHEKIRNTREHMAKRAARDYLPTMASSVSSEQPFSSAGIIISKRGNQLKPDIVEALQCLKCLYKNELIFHDVLLSSTVEKDLDGRRFWV